MPVNANLLNDIPDVGTAQQQQAPAAASSSNNSTPSSGNILDEVPDVAPVAQPAVEAPAKNAPVSLHSENTGFPNNASDENLRTAGSVMTKYLGANFATPYSDKELEAPQTTGAATMREVKDKYLGADARLQPAPVVNAETIQKARKDVGAEINAAPQYLIKDLNKAIGTLPPEAINTMQQALGMDKNSFIQQVVDNKHGGELLQKYYGLRMGLLQQQMAKEKNDLQSNLQLKMQEQQYMPEDMKKDYAVDYHAQVKAVDDKYKKQIDNFNQAAFSMAAIKAVNDNPNVANWSPTYTAEGAQEIGIKVRTMMGDGARVQKEQDQWRNYGTFDPTQRVNTQLIGFQALQLATQKAFADGDDKKVQQLQGITADYRKKVLDNNPDFQIQQAKEAISNKIYDKANWFYRSIAGYEVDNNDIKQAGKELGLSDDVVSKIQPGDIKVVQPWDRQVAGAFINTTVVPLADLMHSGDQHLQNALYDAFGDSKFNKTIGIEGHYDDAPQSLPEWWGNSNIGKFLGSQNPETMQLYQSGSKIETDQNSKDYMFRVANPDAGKFNTDVGALASVVYHGAGDIAGFVVGAGETGKILQGANIIKNAAKAEKAGLSAYTYLSSINENYRRATDAVGDKPEDEAKRTALANIYSLVQAATVQILPPKEILDKWITTPAARNMVDLIQEKGFDGLNKKLLSNYVIDGLKESVKDVAVFGSQPVLNTIGEAVGDMMFAPDKYKDTNYWSQIKQNAVTGAIAGMLPITLGNIRQAKLASPMYKKALWEVGRNPQLFIDDLNERVKNGTLARAEADAKIGVINKVSQIVSSSVPQSSMVNGKDLTQSQQMDYAHNLVQEQLAAQQKSTVNDAVQGQQLDGYMKDLATDREAILANAGDPGADRSAEVVPAHESNITVQDMMDQPVSMDGVKGRLMIDPENENTVVWKEDGVDRIREVGNLANIGEHSIKDYGLEAENNIVSIHPESGNIVVRGREYTTSLYSDPTRAINYDKNGDVISVTLNTTDGKRRTFQGNVAEDIAYQIHLSELTKQNETEAYEHFVNTHPEAERILDNGPDNEPVPGETTKTDESVPAAAAEPIPRQKNTVIEDFSSPKKQKNAKDQRKEGQQGQDVLAPPEEVPGQEPATSSSISFEEEPDFMEERGKAAPEELQPQVKPNNDAISSSNRPEQKSPTEGNIGEHIGTDQREPGQTTGTEAVPAADNSNSDARSTGQESQVLKNALPGAPRSAAEQAISSQVGDNIRAKFDAAPKEEGHKGTVTLSDGSKLKGNYVLTTADAMTASHDPHSFASSEGFPMLEGNRNPNDRDYENDADNRATVVDFANDYNGEAIKNIPTVDRNGIVLDGNNRVMSGKLAAEQGTDGAYLEALKDNAHLYGFDPEKVQEMSNNGEHPRVIFVPDEILPYETTTFAKFNKDNKKAKSPLEEAIEMRRTLPDDFGERMAGVLEPFESMTDFYGDVAAQHQAIKMLEDAGVVNSSNRKKYFDSENGVLTDDGRKLLNNIMLSQVLDEGALRAIQNNDHVMTAVTKAVKNVLTIDRLTGEDMSGTVNAAVKLVDAVEKHLNSVKPKNRSDKMAALESYVSQVPLFDRGNPIENAAVVNVYEWLAQGNTFLNKRSAEMVEMAKEGNKSSMDIFGNLPKSKAELIETAKKVADEFDKAGEEVVGPDAGDSINPGDNGADGNIEETNPVNQQTENATSETERAADTQPAEVSQVGDNTSMSTAERLQEATDEYNKYNDFITKKERRMADLEEAGQHDSLEYKQQYAALQKYKAEQEDAYDQVKKLTKEHAKETANDFRKKYKIKSNDNGLILAASPLAAAIQTTKVVGRTLYNAAIETIALAYENVPNWHLAINEGINFINDRIHTAWPEKEFRDMLMASNPVTAKEVMALQVDDIKMTPKNKQSADMLIDAIKNNHHSLRSAIDHVRNLDGISAKTKDRIIKYLNREVNDKVYKETGNELADRHLNDAMGHYDDALQRLEEDTDTRILGADTDTQRENIRNEYAQAKSQLEIGKTVAGVKDGSIEPVYKRPDEPPAPDAFTAPERKTKDIIQEYTQDKLARLARLQEKSKQAITPENDALTAYRLKKSKAWSTINEIRQYLGNTEHVKDSFFDRLKKDAIDIQKFGTYLYAKHAPERNAYNAEYRQHIFDSKVRELNNDIANEADPAKRAEMQNELDEILAQKNREFVLMPDGGSGMTNAQAADIMAAAKADGMEAKYEKYAKEFRTNVIDKILDYKHESGIVDDVTYNQLREYYKDYVPLKVDMEEEEMGVRDKKQLSNSNFSGRDLYESKGAVHREFGERYNPVLQSIHDLQKAIIRGEDNKANTALANLAVANPDPAIWSVRAPEYKTIRDKDGNIVYQREINQPKDAVPYFANGRKGYVVLHDKGLQNVIKKVGNQTFNNWIQKPTRLFTTVNTLANPAFIAKNPFVDVQDAAMSLYSGQGPEAAKKFASYIPKSFKLVGEIYGGKGNSEWAPWIKDWKDHGGEISFMNDVGIEKEAKDSLKIFEKYDNKFGRANVNHVFHNLEKLSTGLEQMTRVMAYRSTVEAMAEGIAKDKGITIDEAMKEVNKDQAAVISRNATVDFEKKGVFGTYINAFKAFANAGTQGLANVFYLMNNKNTRGRMGKFIGFMVASGVAEALIGNAIGDCPTSEDCYWQQNESSKMKTMLIPMKMFGGSGYFRLPIGRAFGWFNYIGKTAVAAMLGHQTAGKATANIMSSMLDFYNPVGGSAPLEQQIAGNLAPIPQLATNKNSFGSQIEPDNTQGLPEHRNYFPSTRKELVGITNFLSEHTGGSAQQEGLIDVSPNKLDFFMSNAFGGLYQFFYKNAYGSVADAASGDPVKAKNVPFVNIFYRESEMAQSKQDYYDMAERSKKEVFDDKTQEKFKQTLNDLEEGGQITPEQKGKRFNYVEKNQTTIRNRIKKEEGSKGEGEQIDYEPTEPAEKIKPDTP